MEYFNSIGIKTWGQLADHFDIDLEQLVGDEDIERGDYLFNCIILDEWAANEDTMMVAGK